MAGVIRGIALDLQTTPIPLASVYVTDHTTGGLADLYADDELSVPASNPLTTDDRGKWHAYVASGIYDARTVFAGTESSDPYYEVG